MAAFITQAILK